VPSRKLWREALDANLTGTFLTLKAFLPGMISRRRGSIIAVASTAGRFHRLLLLMALAKSLFARDAFRTTRALCALPSTSKENERLYASGSLNLHY